MKNKHELIKQLEKANAKDLEREFYNTDAILKENEKKITNTERKLVKGKTTKR